MKRVACLAMTLFAANAAAEDLYGFTQAERIEYAEAAEATVWDLQGRYGGDYHRFAWKAEGHATDGGDEFEVQLLYSRAFTAYFDLQLGVRFEDIDGIERNSFVAGLQGMAPYKFEVDAAAFISEDGDISLRAEFERDWLLSRQWVLQPRAEIDAALGDVPELGIGSGINHVSLGLRLRWEYTRKFAPYVGVEYERAFGDSADLLRAIGEDDDEFTALAGLRFWF